MSDETSKPKAAAGWYPHPSMADTRRYWDGAAWTDNIAPMDRPVQASTSASDGTPLAGVLIVAAAVVGTFMALQSASLLTGTGTQWTGVAICFGACVVGGFMRRSISWGFRLVVVAATLISFINVTTLESDLDEKRQEIDRILP